MKLGAGSKFATAIVGAFGVSAVAVLALWVGFPWWLRGELEARAARRGLRLTVGEIDVSSAGVTLRDVEASTAGAELVVRVARVEALGRWSALVSRGAAGLTRIRVVGGEVRADLSNGLPARPSVGATSGSTPRAAPRVDLEGFSVEARDQEGVLVHAEGVRGTWEQGRITLMGADTTVAPDGPSSLALGDWQVGADREAGTLERASAHGVTWNLTETAGPSAAHALVARLVQAVGRLHRPGRAEEGAASGSTEDGSGSATESPAPVAAAARLAPEPSASSGAAWDRLGAAFTLDVEDIRVRQDRPGASVEILRDLDVHLVRSAADVFHTHGQGALDGDGTVAWQLQVEPRALRAEGTVDFERVSLALAEPFLPPELPLFEPEGARLTGALSIEGAGESLHATGRLSIEELAIEAARIAPGPVRGMSLTAEGEATFRPAARRLEIASLRFGVGQAEVSARGAIEWTRDHWLVDLESRMPPTACGTAVAAIPVDLLQEAAGFELDGTLSGRLDVRVDSRALAESVLRLEVQDGCRFTAVPALAVLARFDGPFVHRVEEPDGTVFEMSTGPGTEAWTPIADVSPFLLQAVLGHEDGAFFTHSGFSPRAIRDAMVRNLEAGRYVLGASTISMQLAKNVFLRREKTLARKVQEVLLTWWLERTWPKERILELYVNVIEYGPGIYGIRQASRHYFGVEPAELSPAESAYLATILPSPKTFHEHWDAGVLPRSWVPRLQRFLRVLGERGRFDATAVAEGMAELPTMRFQRPGDPPVAPRSFAGLATPLPIEGELSMDGGGWEPAFADFGGDLNDGQDTQGDAPDDEGPDVGEP